MNIINKIIQYNNTTRYNTHIRDAHNNIWIKNFIKYI